MAGLRLHTDPLVRKMVQPGNALESLMPNSLLLIQYTFKECTTGTGIGLDLKRGTGQDIGDGQRG